MAFPRFSRNINIGIAICLAFLVIIVMLLALANRVPCKASNLAPMNPVEKTYRGFTKNSACQKAVAVCMMYADKAKDCVVVE